MSPWLWFFWGLGWARDRRTIISGCTRVWGCLWVANRCLIDWVIALFTVSVLTIVLVEKFWRYCCGY